MRLLHWLNQVLDRVCVVLGAFIGSQIPEFMQQYTQRLAGHVDELKGLLSGLHQAAARSGKTLDQYIHKFITNADPDFASQGEFMQGMVNRWQELHQALQHIMESSFWMKPYVFLKELNYPIAQSAFEAFQPGLNLTIEGMCYAGVGIIMGYAVYHCVSKCLAIGYGRAVSLFKQAV